jgi:hypothetical protein
MKEMILWEGDGFIPVSTRQMKRYIFRLLILIIAVAIYACSSENLEITSERLGIAYFPLESGNFRVYEISEVLYNTQGKDKLSYFLKEKVLDSFENFEGGESFRIERSVKLNADDPWQLDSIWSARRNDQLAVMVENNIPFVKLVFPLEEDKSWDGNILNERDQDDYTMTQVKRVYDDSLGNVYDRTVTIVQEENRDPIVQTNLRKEIYAENIGLVYKESRIFDFCTVDCEFLGDTVAGRDFKMRLIEYGME